MAAGSEDFFARLGFDARAIILGAERANTALGKLTAGTLALANATSRYNKVAEIQIRRLKDLAKTRGAADNLKKINTAARSTATSFRILSNNVKSASTAINTTTATLTKNIQSANKSSGELLLSWRSVIRIFAVQLAHRTVALLTNAIRDSITAAAELSTKIAEVQTISQNNALATRQWTTQLRALADSFSLDILDQTEAAYQALSSQVVKGAQSFGFLADANRLALATVSSAANAVGILSATINAFELNVSDADEISASFFKTIELGRLRLSEIANTFGRVAVPASQLGIELNELQAALTVTTIKGVPAAEAMTFIRNVILKLIRPTKEMKKFFRELGVASGQAAIEAFGLGGFLARLEERTRGSATEIGKLFGRIRAIGGAMIFAGDGVDRFRVALDAIKNSSLSFQRAVDIILSSTGTRFDIELSRIRSFFILEFGDPILETVLNISDELGGLANVVKTLTQTFIALGAGAAAALTVLAFATPLGQTVLAVGALVTAFNLLVGSINAVAAAERKRNKDFQDAQIDAALSARKAAEAQVKVIQEITKLQNRAISQSVATVVAELNNLDQAGLRAIKSLNASLKESFKDLSKAAKADVKEFETAIKATRKELISLQDNVQKLADEQETFNFEFGFDDTNIENQLKALRGRLKDFAVQGIKLIDEGNLKLGRDRLKEARSLLVRIDKIQRKTTEDNIKGLNTRKDIDIKLAKLAEDTARKQLRLQENLTLKQRQKKRSFSEERNIRRKLVDLDRTARDTLIKLLTERNKVIIQRTKEVDIQKEFNRLIVAQQKVEKKLAEQRTKQLEDEEKRLLNAKLISNEFKRLSDLSRISIKEITDVRTVEEQKALFKEREDAILRSIKLSKQLGLTDEVRIRLSERLEREREFVANSIRRQEITDAQESLKNAQKVRDERLKALKVVNTEQLRLAAVGDVFLARLTAEAERVKVVLESTLIRPEEGTTLRIRFDAAKELVALQERLNVLRKIAPEERTAQDLAQAEKIAIRIRDQFAKLEPGRFFDVTPQSLAKIDNLVTAINNNIKQQLNNLTQFQKQQAVSIQNSKDLQALIKTTEASIKAAGGGVKTFAELIEALAKANRDLAESQFEVLRASRLAVRQTIENPLDRNPLARAAGGFTPQGTDSIPALLSPGEFVVNARSTRQFFNQLRTMNSGVQRFANGGLVGGNSTTIGDINITAQASGSVAMDVVKVGQQLRREIRRGRLSL